jgi:hypothetical protein
MLYHLLLEQPVGYFAIILDGVALPDPLHLPHECNWVLCVEQLQAIPQHIRRGALLMNMQRIRAREEALGLPPALQAGRLVQPPGGAVLM